MTTPNPNIADAAAELLARRKARTSFLDYCKYINPLQKPAHHHEVIIEHLQAVANKKIRRLMLFLPPGSAKSTYGTVNFSSWYLGINSQSSLITASHASQLAADFGRKIRNTMQSPEYHNVFPHTAISKNHTAADHFSNINGGEFYATGIGGSITGRRASGVIIDDPVKSRDEADSETMRNKTWEWYTSDMLTRLKPHGWVVIIQTRWHMDDLSGRLLKEIENGTGDEWVVVNIPMEAEEDDILGRLPGERLWPEYFTEKMVADAKKDLRNWTALYQQRPAPMGGGEFKREFMRYYTTKPIHEQMNRYLLVDPAGSKKERADYTAMFVVGLNADDNYYVLDVVRDKMDLTERVRRVMELHRKWKPRGVGYEKYSFQCDTEAIKMVQEQENYRFGIVELGGMLSKEDRIRRLLPLFENGRIWFPENLWKTDYSGKTRDLIEDFVEQEFLNFPVAIRDDMLDALARIVDPDLGAMFPLTTPQNLYLLNDTSKSRWL